MLDIVLLPFFWPICPPHLLICLNAMLQTLPSPPGPGIPYIGPHFSVFTSLEPWESSSLPAHIPNHLANGRIRKKKRYLFFLCLETQYQKLEFLVHCVNHTTGGFCTRLAL
jgi:hypothetical protein